MKVLVVDNERLIVEDLCHEVESLFPVATTCGVTTPDEAVYEAKRTEFDIALLDIDMPGMDGLTLARKLISLTPTINIIFVTGYKEYAFEAHQVYCSGFLMKPVSEKNLKKAFENLRKPFIDLSEEFFAQHYQGSNLIGKKLEMYREQRGLSRQEAADLVGVTRQTIFRWEHGERLPDILTFLRIARIIGIELSDMLDTEGLEETTTAPAE